MTKGNFWKTTKYNLSLREKIIFKKKKKKHVFPTDLYVEESGYLIG